MGQQSSYCLWDACNLKFAILELRMSGEGEARGANNQYLVRRSCSLWDGPAVAVYGTNAHLVNLISNVYEVMNWNAPPSQCGTPMCPQVTGYGTHRRLQFMG